jgi:hypothetical protein
MFDDLINKAKGMVMESDMVTGVIATAKAKAADLGISSEIFDELATSAKEMLADGKLSKEEIIAEVKKLAEQKGVSPDVIEKVLGFLQ